MKKILLIEDNFLFIKLISALVNSAPLDHKYTLIYRDNLDAGIQRLQRGGIDVLILDLNLHDTEGEDTFNEILSRFPRLPVVIVTGANDPLFEKEAFDKGAQDYLLKKNININTFFAVIQKAIRRKKRENEIIAKN